MIKKNKIRVRMSYSLATYKIWNWYDFVISHWIIVIYDKTAILQFMVSMSIENITYEGYPALPKMYNGMQYFWCEEKGLNTHRWGDVSLEYLF